MLSIDTVIKLLKMFLIETLRGNRTGTNCAAKIHHKTVF